MKNFFTLLVVFFPLLSVYISPIPGVDLATLILLIFIPIVFLQDKYKEVSINRCYMMHIGFWVLIFTTSLINYFDLRSEDTILILARYLKFFILILSCLILSATNIFQKEEAICYLLKIAKISSIIIIIQQLLFTLKGIVVELVYKPFVIDRSYDVVIDVTQLSLYRPTAFFLEPAYFAQYVVIALAIAVCRTDTKDIDIFLMYSGILMSTSGSGILIATILIGIFTYNRLINNIGIKRNLLFFIVLVVSLSGSNLDVVSKAIERIDISDETGQSAFWGRMGGYSYIFNELDLSNMIFGHGLGNVPLGYFNGIAYMIVTIGLLGLVLFLIIFGLTYFNGEKYQKFLVIVYLYYILGAQLFTPNYLFFFIPLLLTQKKVYSQFKNPRVDR